MRNEGCVVIILQAFILFIVSWVGNLLMGYNLDIWLGYEAWFEVNFLLRIIMGFLSVTVLIPLTVIGFVLALVFGKPLLI